MKRLKGYRAIIPLAVAAIFGAPAADAQQVLEIDYATGRTIIDDQWRSMRASDLAVDRGRGILYVIDAEEPEGVMAFSHGPDSVFVYHRGGEVGRVAVPTDFADWSEDCGEEVTTPSGQVWLVPCPIWNRGLYPSFDGRGNLVLFSEVDFETAGTIIAPETGCYAIVRKDPSTDKARVPVRIVGDSVLVFRNHSEPNENGGTTYYTDSANRASLHPLRRVSCEPCPGKLPTVQGVG